MQPSPSAEDWIGKRVSLGPYKNGAFESSWTRIDHGRTGVIAGKAAPPDAKTLERLSQPPAVYLVFRPDERLKRDPGDWWLVSPNQIYLSPTPHAPAEPRECADLPSSVSTREAP